MMNAATSFPISANLSHAIKSNNNSVKLLISTTFKNVPMLLLNHAALGWREALSSIMHELRVLENEQWHLKQYEGVNIAPPIADLQPLITFGSSLVHWSYHKGTNSDHDGPPSIPRLMRCFVYTKVFNICSVTSPQQVEIAAACVIFNAALTNHLAGLHLMSPPQEDAGSGRSKCMQILLSAARLYQSGLHILQQKMDPINKDASDTLLVVTLNNFAAVLTAMGPSFSSQAHDVNQRLFLCLSQIDMVAANPLLLDVSDINSIYDACLSVVFQIHSVMTAPAA
jgi:hypothetical protein